ncbi:uncharacterized protein LOC142204493 [Leptodactylus fuscus]|uniref:uncharacterized protein LOC142204493 n=1 Tax=Leptodactylus fuscus TaxID=238119 RepID=UPI003F4E8BB0
MSVPLAGDPMGLPGALKGVNQKAVTALEKGVTPVRVDAMRPYLNEYGNVEAAKLLLEGFLWGFKIPFVEGGSVVIHKNLRSAYQHPQVVSDKLAKELELGRMAGPFSELSLPNLRVSPLGVVPKKEPNKFRLIHHLSFPKGTSVNDGIDPSLCAVVYTSFDAAIRWVREFGCGALLAKADVEAAFRLLPVHPDLGSFPGAGSTSTGNWGSLARGPLGAAVRAAQSLINVSLAEGTWAGYGAAWGKWVEWSAAFGSQIEGEGERLLLLVGQCREEGWSLSRVNKFLAGLAFGFKARGLPDATKHFLVRQAMRGWRRGGTARDSRRPILFQLLLSLGSALKVVCRSVAELRLFRLAFSLAFFGAMRLGELLSPSRSVPGGLLAGDVRLFEDSLEFFIRRSKTDLMGRGAKVVLFAVPGVDMCPVVCLREFLSHERPAGTPLLTHEDGSFLSRFQFLAIFKKCLVHCGRLPADFGGHSFMIGAATEAARNGLAEDVIRRIGCWESMRFRSYVRLDSL